MIKLQTLLGNACHQTLKQHIFGGFNHLGDSIGDGAIVCGVIQIVGNARFGEVHFQIDIYLNGLTSLSFMGKNANKCHLAKATDVHVVASHALLSI